MQREYVWRAYDVKIYLKHFSLDMLPWKQINL